MEEIRQAIDKQLMYYNRIITIAVVFIAVGVVFYHQVEKMAWLDSFYFTVVTLATVGYGDFTPKTPAGKLFTVFYILIGITIFVALARVVAARAVERRMNVKQKRNR